MIVYSDVTLKVPFKYKHDYFSPINMPLYYMAVPHKEWELPISRIWLAKIDIERGLDFPI